MMAVCFPRKQTCYAATVSTWQ